MWAKSPQHQGCFNKSNSEARKKEKKSRTRKERELVPHARQELHTQANTTQLLGDS